MKEFAIACDPKSEAFRAFVLEDKLNGPFLVVVVDCGVGRKI
jgi:hypothetical protein